MVALVCYGADQLTGIKLKAHGYREEVVPGEVVATSASQRTHVGQTHGLAELLEVFLQNEHDLCRVASGLHDAGVVVLYPLLKAFVLDRFHISISLVWSS